MIEDEEERETGTRLPRTRLSSTILLAGRSTRIPLKLFWLDPKIHRAFFSLARALKLDSSVLVSASACSVWRCFLPPLLSLPNDSLILILSPTTTPSSTLFLPSLPPFRMAPIATETETFPSAKVELKQLKNELSPSQAGAKMVDYSKFLSTEAASRYPSPLKDIAVK